MRIRHVSVRGLFDTFDHEIDLNQQERVTVLVGPNGFGKTSVLRLLHALFNEEYPFPTLHLVPFRELRVTFDDGSLLRIERQVLSGAQVCIDLYRQPAEGPEERVLGVLPLPVLQHQPATLFGPRTYQIGRKEYVTFAQTEVERLPWYRELRAALHVHFIQTERLHSRLEQQELGGPETEPTVQAQARALAGLIENTLAENGGFGTSLERSFPRRLLENAGRTALTTDEIQTRLRELDAKRAKLMRLGILAAEATEELPSQFIDEQSRTVLTLYIEDTEKKLAVFDHLADRLDLFHHIVAQRFLYKVLRTNREQGFAFTGRNGAPLPATALSSGEQHELILFYQLLFKVGPDTLILVDEPEISLHVAWQMEFLKDLLAAAKLGSFDAIVATHSPQIVNDRWDLAVELKGPEA